MVLETSSTGLYRMHREVTPNGVHEESEYLPFSPGGGGLDRTLDPGGDASGGGFRAAGENPDFELKDPNRVNPGRMSEETRTPPQLMLDPEDLLVNPDPDAASGPERKLDGPLPPMTNPNRVLPPKPTQA